MRPIAPLILSIAMFAVACSSDSDPSATDATDVETTGSSDQASSEFDTAAFCEDREELRTSFESLRDYSVLAEGVNGLTERLQGIRDDVAALADSASDEVRDEIDAVGTSIDALQEGVTAASSPADVATALRSGLGGVSTAFQNLTEATASIDCD